MLARGLGVLLLLWTAFLCGCGGDQVVEIQRWTLQVGAGAPTAITLPTHVTERLPRAPSTYTLHADPALPPELRGKDLVLTIPNLCAKTTLVVAGTPAIAFEEDSDAAYRSRGPHAWRIPRDLTQAPALDLTLSVEHEWTQSGWLDSVPRLSASRKGDATFRRVSAFNEVANVAALSTLVLFGFTHVVLFLLDRRRTQNGWFSLQALTAAMYPCFLLGYSQYLFGTYDTCVFAVSQVFPPIGGLLFTRAAFKLGPPPRIYGALCILVGVIAVLGPGPFTTTRVLGPVVVVVGQIAIVHHLFTLGGLARRRPRPKNTMVLLAALLVVLVGYLFDGPPWLGLGEPFEGVRVGSWGGVLVVLLQSVALSRDHIVSLNRSDALNAELGIRVALLESRQGEIQVLNDELRRQIAERSRQMSAAFTRIALGAREESHDLLPGDIVEQRYRVVRAVGAGGMGCVYEVERVQDARRLALKVLLKLDDGIAVARFAREAQIASSVDHPNVVAVVDVAIAASGYLFLVMELVDGVSLAEKRSRFGDVRWALGVLRGMAEGLTAIHAAGVVHRDLKPSNVLLAVGAGDDENQPKISDFGISSLVPTSVAKLPVRHVEETTMRLPGAAPARAPDSTDRDAEIAPLTRTGMIMGTPVYMAPELVDGANTARPAADVFSLGVIAFEILTGRRPFAEAPVLAMLRGVQEPPPPPALSTLVPELSPEIADWVDRALSVQQGARGTAQELADLFAAAGDRVTA